MLLKHYLDRGVSKAELSRRFGVNRRTIHNWVDTGQLDRGHCHVTAWLRHGRCFSVSGCARYPTVVTAFHRSSSKHAVWLYCRFTLSYRDVEDLLAERGLDISYETVRRWVLKFGRAYARRIQRRRPRPTERWHLDEMVGPC